MKNNIEVHYTGGGIWLAEKNLGNGTYAVVNSEYDNCLSIYNYTDDESYMSEDMIFSETIENMDPEQVKIYNELYKALITKN